MQNGAKIAAELEKTQAQQLENIEKCYQEIECCGNNNEKLLQSILDELKGISKKLDEINLKLKTN